MCGIAGLFEYGGGTADPTLLQAMTDSMAHRGPDAEGVYTRGAIGLGHRRLAILDPTPAANQPLIVEGGAVVISFNGEIYNFHEVRRELIQRGHEIATNGDTEVIAHAYLEWGVQCLEKLSGIFAFALWDEREQRLFLARDPLGVKPLFYADDGQRVHFGSEAKAILCDPRVSREISDEGLDAFFSFSYCAAPLTALRDIRQIMPGHYALVDRDGVKERRYWSIPYEERPYERPFDELREEFHALFDRVVQRQLISDVPVGVFLSGGLDSGAIATAVQRSGATSFPAFSAGFREAAYNELSAARLSAEATGANLSEALLDLDSVALLPEIVQFMDEPTADSSMLPLYLLSKMSAERVKVVLSGDGADELLAGYETYRASAWAASYRLLPRFLRRGVLQPLARRIPMADRKYNLHQVATRFTQGAEAGPGRDHCSWRLAFDEKLKSRLYNEKFRARSGGFDPVGSYADTMSEVPAHFGQLAARLHADATFHLPNDMLVKVDRMSMAHGLEVRVPFLDVDLVAFCANLPPQAKLYRGKVRKHILRESMRGLLPEEILNRPKSGFNIPLEQWMRAPAMRALLFDTLHQHRSPARDYLQCDAVEVAWKEHAARKADHGHALFAVLVFALWCGRLHA